ncbi:MAG: hypothetical protein AUG17_06470 [Crenarchaeota archaeon 13_1_20CM_2_53_14]|nr:MAG: hypothetical protein AUG17_06470 [Crenarchaeota archaeon 13_1_20CM_2_53_14]
MQIDTIAFAIPQQFGVAGRQQLIGMPSDPIEVDGDSGGCLEETGVASTISANTVGSCVMR